MKVINYQCSGHEVTIVVLDAGERELVRIARRQMPSGHATSSRADAEIKAVNRVLDQIGGVE